MRELVESVAVDAVDDVAPRGDGDGQFRTCGRQCVGAVAWGETAVDGGKVGSGWMSVAHAVEQAHELGVALAVDFSQFDWHKGYFFKNFGVEEIGRAVLARYYVACVGCDYGLELEDIANHENLLAGERAAHVAAMQRAAAGL